MNTPSFIKVQGDSYVFAMMERSNSMFQRSIFPINLLSL